MLYLINPLDNLQDKNKMIHFHILIREQIFFPIIKTNIIVK